MYMESTAKVADTRKTSNPRSGLLKPSGSIFPRSRYFRLSHSGFRPLHEMDTREMETNGNILTGILKKRPSNGWHAAQNAEWVADRRAIGVYRMFKRAASLLILGIVLSSCASVQVKKIGDSTYSLKCHSRGKCDREAKKICGGKKVKVVTQSETHEVSKPFLFWGIWGERPVTRQSITCEGG